MSNSQFPFVTTHGRVLAFLAKHPRGTTRQIAEAVGITDRTAYAVIRDLAKEGYITRKRVGRQNLYKLKTRAFIAEDPERDTTVNDLARVLRYGKPREQVNTSREKVAVQ
jgi:DNA-binding transcriptional ArsR family regulator